MHEVTAYESMSSEPATQLGWLIRMVIAGYSQMRVYRGSQAERRVGAVRWEMGEVFRRWRFLRQPPDRPRRARRYPRGSLSLR